MIELRGAIQPVRDMSRALQWYQDWLGCSPVVERKGYVRFEVGAGALELVLADDVEDVAPRSAAGIWGVSDIQEHWERLLKAGATAVEDPHQREGGVWVASLRDPEGNRLVLMEGAGESRRDTPVPMAASGESLQSIEVERIISAPRERVWQAWTRQEELGAWFGSDARFELRIGGPFEIYFAPGPGGARGSEGCRVLSYLPGRMLSFTWNAPPDQPTRGWHTWVVVELANIDSVKAVTRLRLTHTGWPKVEGDVQSSDAASGKPDAAQWQETFNYFQRAWPQVMTALERHLGTSPGH